MFETINDYLLLLADPLMNWLLVLPRDLVLVLVSIGTALVLTLMRTFSTNQDLLRRCDHDKKTLTRRLRAVKKRDHSEAVYSQVAAVREGAALHGFELEEIDAHRLGKLLKRAFKRMDIFRLRATKNSVAMKTLRQEGLPLLVSLPLIALIAVWAFARIGYFPPQADEPVTVTLYVPRSDTGSLVHLLPVEGLESEGGWIRQVELETDQGQVYGVARWTLRGRSAEEPYPLVIRSASQTWTHRIRIGARTYAPPLIFLDQRGEYVLEVHLEPYKPFGIIGQIPGIPLAPWILGYLLIVIPFVPLLKRGLKIY